MLSTEEKIILLTWCEMVAVFSCARVKKIKRMKEWFSILHNIDRLKLKYEELG